MFLAACVQMSSDTDVTANLKRAEVYIRRAAAAGASLIITPENTALLGPQFHKVEFAEALDGRIGSHFSALADELGVHLLIGSIAERRLDSEGKLDTQRCYNTSVIFDPQGHLIASYRKLHLFDVDVPGGLTINESDSICAGEDLVVAETALGNIGLSICYDLRFPEMYRALTEMGAELITVPSAFTLTTGKDHWHTLLRTRAIECQSWVLAPGQWGQHDAKGMRQSYGHSVIIDPWGAVVADKGQGEGICYAEIDLERVRQIRASIPVSNHRRVRQGQILPAPR
jgi:predicted amidohydrolase